MLTEHTTSKDNAHSAKWLAHAILARLPDAIALPYRQAGLRGTGPDNPDWLPEEQHCHANVEIWLRYSEDYRPLRGYMILEPQRRGLPGSVMPHSALIGPDGMALDITPRAYGQSFLPFVLHIGTTKQWELMKKTQLVEVH